MKKLKVAIIGHGKMGRMIEDILIERGHDVVCVIDENNTEDFTSPAFASADVAIEFTRPASAVDNILKAFAAKVPVVSGTTGWTDSLPELKEMCAQGKGALLWSSNFSLGMNMFMAVNRHLAKLMEGFTGYAPSMEEVHHVHKVDHPSGTAITLAEDIIACNRNVKSWKECAEGEIAKGNELPITAIRQGEVPGIHAVTWDSDADEIIITHSAKNRHGFAMGAVLAAEWLAANSKGFGFYTMKDVLGF